MGPLAGVRVLEAGDLAAAFAGRLLADLGAEVVRLEGPQDEPLRRLGPRLRDGEGAERGLPWQFYHAGKRAASAPPDSEARERWLAGADALLLGGRAADLRAGGWDAAALLRRFPRLVVCCVAPFGMSGPKASWRACDTVAQAAGGMLLLNGHPDEAPLRSFGAQAIHAAGLHAAIGVVLALIARQAGRGGQLVEVSVQEAVIAMVEHATALWWQRGTVERRRGTLHWTGAFRAGRCRGGWVLYSHLGDWTTLAEWVAAETGDREILRPEWADYTYRREHAERLFEILDRWGRRWRAEDLAREAQLRRLPFAPLRRLSDVGRDPHLLARGFFEEVPRPGGGSPVRFPRPPFRFSASPLGPRRGAPGRPDGAGPPADWQPRAPEPCGPPAGPQPPLRGLRVVDLTHMVAGPYATRVLADFGAEVVRVEHPRTPTGDGRRDGVFAELNRGKRSVAIDLSRPQGVALLRSLLAGADVLVENFSPRVLEGWGLPPAELLRANPRLVCVRLPGFGCSGPRRHDVSYGPTVQALAGHTWSMRHPRRPPAGWGFSFSDTAAGAHGALAALAALFWRQRGGSGQEVEVSQYEALVSLGGPTMLHVLGGAPEPPPAANRPPLGNPCPHGVFPCAPREGRERWIAISVGGEAAWRALAAAAGQGWAEDPRFRRARDRRRHRHVLARLVAAWTRRADAERLASTLQSAGVAAAALADARDLAEGDAHLRARGFWCTLASPGGARTTVQAPAVRLQSTPGRPAGPAPLLGEHTEEVLRERLGLGEAELQRLRGEGIVA